MEFDKEKFNQKVAAITKGTTEKLREYFPEAKSIQVIPINKRDISAKGQKSLKRQGKSKTTLSMHQVGAGKDFLIKIDGKRYNSRQKTHVHPVQPGEYLSTIAKKYLVGVKDIKKWNNMKGDVIHPGQKLSIKGEGNIAYRVLGGQAKSHGLFWGWMDDSGHVADKRFVSDFVKDYPASAGSSVIMDWYNENFDETKKKYKPIMTQLDRIFARSNKNRKYTGDFRIIDELHTPLGMAPEDQAWRSIVYQK